MRKDSVLSPSLDGWIVDRLRRRIAPIVVAVVYVALGLLYVFRWGSVVRHIPSLWITPPDLSGIYQASSAFAHGHLGAVYHANSGFLSLPGFLIALAPLGALSSGFHTTFVEITKNHHLVTHPEYLVSQSAHFWDSGTIFSGANHANEYSVQPQWFAYVFPYILVLSCLALFACDALAERLQVNRARRAVLSLAQGVALWPVIVFWGHPEDALAVALAVYALWFALDHRFGWAGWLFGAAVAVQPLVIVVFPILLVLGGRQRVFGLMVRGVVPAAAAIAGPLMAGFHATVHAVVTQPMHPDLKGTHQTPWTFLAPKLGGKGPHRTVGGGRTRFVALALAAAVGWWSRRWRQKPEMLVWAAALALALRTYTESVMTSYYVWPALAIGLVVAACGSRRRFGLSVALAIGVTIGAQLNLQWFPWWLIEVAGVTGLLVAAASPEPPEPVMPVAPRSKRAGATTKSRARADKKRSARR
ncbi:MAG TPA: hypothetical protein VII76_09900 [Acidimicrobiales bacterium]